MKRLLIIAIMVLMLIPEMSDAQCAMCRAVLESEEGQETAKGVNNGIIYLMAVPYLLVGGLGYFIYRSFKKRATQE